MNPTQLIEKSFLCTLILDPSSLKEASIIKPNQIQTLSYRKIYNVILELSKQGKPIEESYIFGMINEAETEEFIDIIAYSAYSNIKHYIQEIQRLEKERSFNLSLSQLISNDKFKIEEKVELLQILSQNLEEEQGESTLFSIKNSANIKAEKPYFYLYNIFPIQNNEVTLISASGGTGKSWIALWLLLQLRKEHNLKVFGFLSEDSLGGTKHRIEILRKTNPEFTNIEIDFIGKESRPEAIFSYDNRHNLQVSDYFYQLKLALKSYDIIVIDPLIAFAGGDENSNVDARFMINLLNAWCIKENKSIILLHHHSKNNLVRGASAYVDAVRLHYSIEKGDDTSMRIAKLIKTNHYHGKDEFYISLFKTSPQNISKQIDKTKEEINNPYEENAIELDYSFDVQDKKEIHNNWSDNEQENW